MKALHWTLLALALASCRSTLGAGKPASALGPGSRVVMPSPSPPRVERPAPELRESAVAHVEPLAASRTVPSPALEAFAAVLTQALVRWSLLAPPEVATQSPPPLHTDPRTAAESSPLAEASPTPESALEEERSLEALVNRLVAQKRWKELTEVTRRLQALPTLDHARRLHREGNCDEEFALLDRALLENPDQPDLLEAAGGVRLSLAAGGRTELYASARELFARAGPTPTALLGHSRAARALGFHDEALGSARKAVVLLSVQKEQRLALDPAAEVVLAEAGLEVHRRLRATPGPAATALFDEIQAALHAHLREKSTDALAHVRLSELYLDVGRIVEAESAARTGLVSSPSDAKLWELVARSALSVGGPEELLRVFDGLRRSFPQQPLAYWYPALTYFRSSAARVRLPNIDSGAIQLKKAEDGFDLVRQRDARLESSCLEYKALARALAGWELFDGNQLEKARRTFLSMNEIAPGLIGVDPGQVDPEWSGKIHNGLSGLEKIAERYREQKNLAAAAAVYGELAQQASGDARWARAAAESELDAADQLAAEALRFERASRGELTDPKLLERLRKLANVRDRLFESEIGTGKERERFARSGAALRKLSETAYARSWQRYLRAVELAPLDVQLLTDAARVAINHTHAELAKAEVLLSEAIRVARERSEADLKPDEHSQLMFAWASAEAGFGELEDLKNNPQAAVAHYREVLRIDPKRHPHVEEELLPKAIEASNQRPAGTRLETPDPGPARQDRH